MTEIRSEIRWKVELNKEENYRIRYNRGDGHFEDFVDIFPKHLIELIEILNEMEPEIKKHID